MTDILPATVRPSRTQRKTVRSTRPVKPVKMSTEWLEFNIALTTVFGDIDATNSAQVLDYALSKALLCHRLVFDLTRVEFFSCTAYSMLRTLESRCRLAEVEFKVLPSPGVARTMQVCQLAEQCAS